MKIVNHCIICEASSIKKSGAILMPFIADRIFNWKPFVIKRKFNFTTIKNGQVYSICNSIYCNDCHFLFLDIRFDEEEIAKLYLDYRGKAYVNLREKYEPGYKKINSKLSLKLDYLSKIENFILKNISYPKTLLDWGGNTGLNTPFRGKSDVLKSIYDISGNNVLDNIVKIHEISNLKKYDLITCMHIFEHVPYPLQELNKLKKFINKNGHIYIEVPFEQLMKKKISGNKMLEMKKHWHEHINFFSETSLVSLLYKAGFKNIVTDTLAVSNGNKELNILMAIGSI